MYIYRLSTKHHNLYMTDNAIFADKKGLLINEIASRKVNDIVHINLSGIIKLGMLFRSYVTTPHVNINRVDGRPYANVSSMNSMSSGRMQNEKSRVGNISMMDAATTSKETFPALPQPVPS